MADSVARLRVLPKAPKAGPGSEEPRNGNEADTLEDCASDMEEYAKQMQRPDRPWVVIYAVHSSDPGMQYNIAHSS